MDWNTHPLTAQAGVFLDRFADGAIVLGREQTAPVLLVPVEAGGDRNDLVGGRVGRRCREDARREVAAELPRI